MVRNENPSAEPDAAGSGGQRDADPIPADTRLGLTPLGQAALELLRREEED